MALELCNIRPMLLGCEGMVVKLFNSLTGKVEPVRPRPGGRVSMFSCSTLAHQLPTLDELRRMVVVDVLSGLLRSTGVGVRSLTCQMTLDERCFRAAAKNSAKGWDFLPFLAERNMKISAATRAFGTAAATTEFSGQWAREMISVARELIAKGVAFEKDGSVLLRTRDLPSLGELSRAHGAGRGAIPHSGKKQQPSRRGASIPLFKRSRVPGAATAIGIRNPWQGALPSAELQCFSVARAVFDGRYDIHVATTEQRSLHNECELAMSRVLAGQPQARIWLHSAPVQLGSVRSKSSLAKAASLDALLERGYSAEDIRFAFLRTHYRRPVRLTAKSLTESRSLASRVRESMDRLADFDKDEPWVWKLDRRIERAEQDIRKALCNDLDVPAALDAALALLDYACDFVLRHKVCAAHSMHVINVVDGLNSLLGFMPRQAAAT